MKNVKNITAQMTLEEKASLCSGKNFWYLKGIERLGIPSIMVTDGPHGLRKQASSSETVGLADSVPATCFPTASALAATWNRDLIYEVGAALGDECRQEKVGVILGPGANIKRSPLCGRNFEYFSEDPYLSGEMAAAHINGVQSQGIGTSLKHFVANNQEYRRMTIDTIVDERALREIYLAGFEIAVKKAQPWTVMCSYNKINGTYASDHIKLMREVLKDEWGHEGLVVTDWGAMNERVEALKAGTELEMPGAQNGNDAIIVEAVQNGQLDETLLDQAVERILTVIFKADKTLSEEFTYASESHHALARKVAGEGAVLLKNDGNILPLQAHTKVALIGRFAREPRYQGAGSSLMNPSHLENLHDEITALVGKENLAYAPGYTSKGDYAEESLIQEAVNLANSAEVVIICAGLTDLYEVEGLDRDHIKLPPGHDALIEKIAEMHSNIVVVLSNGSPVEMPWANQVPAILEGYLGGQAGAGALADILYGKVNPSGKLAETFPLKLEDNPSYHYFPGGPDIVEYRESIYVGYRYYDTVNQEVLYPFGHGLSYTTFEYSDLQLSQKQLTTSQKLKISFKVKNIGIVAGKEIVQLYVRDLESTAFRPAKELKGFAKVDLQPGEQTEVSIEINWRAFAYFNTDLKDWHVEAGAFEILVGASSKDIRLKETIKITSSSAKAPRPDVENLESYYNFPKGNPVSQAAFEKLLGRPVPPNEGTRKGNHTINSAIGDLGDTFIGRQLMNVTRQQISKMIAGLEDTPTALLMHAMIKEMPLRGMLVFGGGVLNRAMLEALLVMINGKFLEGLAALLRAIAKK